MEGNLNILRVDTRIKNTIIGKQVCKTFRQGFTSIPRLGRGFFIFRDDYILHNNVAH
jgi:hypothetical protein